MDKVKNNDIVIYDNFHNNNFIKNTENDEHNDPNQVLDVIYPIKISLINQALIKPKEENNANNLFTLKKREVINRISNEESKSLERKTIKDLSILDINQIETKEIEKNHNIIKNKDKELESIEEKKEEIRNSTSNIINIEANCKYTEVDKSAVKIVNKESNMKKSSNIEIFDISSKRNINDNKPSDKFVVVDNYVSEIIPISNKKQCRICYENEEECEEKLISPCKCEGSVKFIHQTCIKKSIESLSKKSCEICSSEYLFRINCKKDYSSKVVLKKVRQGLVSLSVWSFVIFLLCLILYFAISSLGNYKDDSDRNNLLRVLLIVGSVLFIIASSYTFIRRNYHTIHVTDWQIVDNENFELENKNDLKRIIQNKLKRDRGEELYNEDGQDDDKIADNISIDENLKDFICAASNNVQIIIMI